MATFSKRLLSGSTDGKQIVIANTATAGTLIHTCVSGTSSLDEIWIYAVNSSTSAVKLTIEYGGTTANTDHIDVGIHGVELPSRSLVRKRSIHRHCAY